VLAYRSETAPRLVPFAEHGLTMSRPAGWFSRVVPPSSSPLAAAIGNAAPVAENAIGLLYHTEFQSPIDPLSRIEIEIARRPRYGNLRNALSLARVSRYGEMYWATERERESLSADRFLSARPDKLDSLETIGGRDWVRTRFRYAFIAGPVGSPQVATGIEYATLNGGLMYVVTFHGDDKEALRLSNLVAGTLGVDPNHPDAIRQ
jgi:hypothetical protein